MRTFNVGETLASFSVGLEGPYEDRTFSAFQMTVKILHCTIETCGTIDCCA
jgi:hypothetical protein